MQGGYESVCNEIWYIYADEAVRRERLKASRGYTDEHIDRILSSQAADSFFREHCDRVIDNSSPDLENTYRQIEEALRDLYGRYCQTEEARRALYGTYCQTEKKLRALSDREENIPVQTHRRPEDASL